MSGIRRTSKEESETGKLNSLNLPRSTRMLLLLSLQCKSPSEKHSKNICAEVSVRILEIFGNNGGLRHCDTWDTKTLDFGRMRCGYLRFLL